LATRHRFLVGGNEHTVVLDEANGALTVAIDDGEPQSLTASAIGLPGTFTLIIEGRPHAAYVQRRAGGYEVIVGGRRFQVGPAGAGRGRGAGGSKDREGEVTAPLAGVVVEIRVAVGDTVDAGQTLLVIEAMKMQNEIQCPVAGKITAIRCEQAGRVEQGAIVVEYDPVKE
jgi:biotin carboxyl carrier protein